MIDLRFRIRFKCYFYCLFIYFLLWNYTYFGIKTWSRPVNSLKLPYQFIGWDVIYLGTLVLKNWILNCFGNAHAGKAFHFFAVRVKKTFWIFDVRSVLKVTARQWVVVPALAFRTRFSRKDIISENSLEQCP